MLLEVIEEAKAFEEEHGEDLSYLDKAVRSLESLARFLWSAKKGLIDELGIADLDNSDTELKTHWLNCHCRNIEGAIEAEQARQANQPNPVGTTTHSNQSPANHPNITTVGPSINELKGGDCSPQVYFAGATVTNEDEMSISSEGETPICKAEEGLDEQSVNILNSITRTNKQKPIFSFDNIEAGNGDAALRMSAAMTSHLSESLDQSNKLKVVEIRTQSHRESEKKNRVNDFHESFPRMYLKECKCNMIRANVNKSMLDCSTIINQCTYHDFKPYLPPSFSQSITNGTKRGRESNEMTGNDGPNPNTPSAGEEMGM